jgi:hypothetical protein
MSSDEGAVCQVHPRAPSPPLSNWPRNFWASPCPPHPTHGSSTETCTSPCTHSSWRSLLLLSIPFAPPPIYASLTPSILPAYPRPPVRAHKKMRGHTSHSFERVLVCRATGRAERSVSGSRRCRLRWGAEEGPKRPLLLPPSSSSHAVSPPAARTGGVKTSQAEYPHIDPKSYQ